MLVITGSYFPHLENLGFFNKSVHVLVGRGKNGKVNDVITKGSRDQVTGSEMSTLK